ncbi:MAG: hypothetical protein NC201_00825 [Prevotella sp.]|nr:hypothetical protein [Prevotella sp.]MCM1436439.1 hypothetical protein [Prevotella sp.]
MDVFFIILSCLLWCGAFRALFKRMLLAPGLSYLALLALSFAERDGMPLMPINNVILISWLSMTIIVMLIVMIQPNVVRRASRGIGYISIGAVAGMAVGLLGFSISEDITLRYSIMVVATAVGTFLGYIMYTNTPTGRMDRPGHQSFFGYLLAKGFPTAITVMQLGVALVIAIALYQN